MVLNRAGTYPDFAARMNQDLGDAPDPARREAILRMVYQSAMPAARQYGVDPRPLPPEAPKAEQPAPADTKLIPEAGALIGAFRKIVGDIIRGRDVSIPDNAALVTFVKDVTGRSPADGSIDTKQIYDLLETALNQEIAEHGGRMMAPGADVLQALANLRTLLSHLPTQAIRSEEQVKYQQFSTPPSLAYVSARVLAPRQSDIVLEPSAGTGGLAAFARAAAPACW